MSATRAAILAALVRVHRKLGGKQIRNLHVRVLDREEQRSVIERHLPALGTGEANAQQRLPSVDNQRVIRNSADKLRNKKKSNTWRPRTPLVPIDVQLHRPEDLDNGVYRGRTLRGLTACRRRRYR